jgi:hypothetical protein
MLDPFAGSGTTGHVAEELGRYAVLIELNPVYVEMQKRRIQSATSSLRPTKVPRPTRRNLPGFIDRPACLWHISARLRRQATASSTAQPNLGTITMSFTEYISIPQCD